jgi:hypothetical protein
MGQADGREKGNMREKEKEFMTLHHGKRENK